MNAQNYSVGLGLYRLILCFLIIKNMCFYFPISDDLFGINGIFPYDSYKELLTANYLGLLEYPFYLSYFPQFFIILIILLASCYLLGYGGRWAGILLFLGLFILKLRNGFILDGSDNVMQVTLPFFNPRRRSNFLRKKR